MSFQEWMDEDELQKLQDIFCDVTGVSAFCLDEQKHIITGSYGKAKDVERAKEYIEDPIVQSLLERVDEDSLEEQVTERIDEIDGLVSVISVKANKELVCYYVVFGFDLPHGTNIYFERVLDLLRETTCSFLASRISCVSAEAESRKNFFAREEMSVNLQDITATTEIVQLLDSDDSVEQIMDKWIGIIGNHLQVDTAQIFQLYSDENLMDVLCQFNNKANVSYFDKTSQVEVPDFLHIEKPLVVSVDNARGELRKEISEYGIKAVMVLPIIKQENGAGMLLSLVFRVAHTWQMTEIKFVADAVKVMQSILTKRIQKNSLASSYAVLEAILDNVGCGIYVNSCDTKEALFANKRLQKMFPTELSDNTFGEMVENVLSKNEFGGNTEMERKENGHWFDLNYKKIAWVDGRTAMLCSFYDITDKKLYQKRIEQQAYTDFLTGLYNRMCCERDLAKHIDYAKKNNVSGVILYLDLDDFKHINDGLGHQYGDVLLKAISHSLQRIEGIENTCYRMGGDEFVIVIPPGHYDRLDDIIEDIKRIFAKPWFLKDADYYCTMSMGIVDYPGHGDNVLDLIKKADIAMYEAKKGGKNRIARYSDGTDTASGKRLNMEKNMRDATVSGYHEFEVYYQPIMDIQGEEIVCAGAEALIRWNSANLGFISPAEFIPLAEYLGLINPIGNHVLREACRHCKEWNENGYPDYKVNVNLSVVQLLQADIVDIVARTLKESGLNPKNLTLEVTESLAINDMERMKEILNSIKKLGVKIALDDFGTGYSSLNHIREIPFDVIKVDQNFVKDLAEDAYSQSFIKMVAELAETIGVSICVEGVERENQYAVLQGMKVKYIQGYYFAKPMPRADFEKKYVINFPVAKETQNV